MPNTRTNFNRFFPERTFAVSSVVVSQPKIGEGIRIPRSEIIIRKNPRKMTVKSSESS
jgi:hypothetical protein